MVLEDILRNPKVEYLHFYLKILCYFLKRLSQIRYFDLAGFEMRYFPHYHCLIGTSHLLKFLVFLLVLLILYLKNQDYQLYFQLVGQTYLGLQCSCLILLIFALNFYQISLARSLILFWLYCFVLNQKFVLSTFCFIKPFLDV